MLPDRLARVRTHPGPAPDRTSTPVAGSGETAGVVSTDRRATDPVLPVLLGGVAALALLGRPFFELFVGSDHPGLQAWATVFVDGRPTARIAATAVTAVPAPAEPYELP
jgi:hypothetical protein